MAQNDGFGGFNANAMTDMLGREEYAGQILANRTVKGVVDGEKQLVSLCLAADQQLLFTFGLGDAGFQRIFHQIADEHGEIIIGNRKLGGDVGFDAAGNAVFFGQLGEVGQQHIQGVVLAVVQVAAGGLGLERVEIMQELRAGVFDVLIGVNLLREGLDLPEVSLVAILDADKEGFLRSHRALTQTIGRAARNINGMAIMYGDKITDSM